MHGPNHPTAPLATRLRDLLAHLTAGLVERDQAVRLSLLAALASEHTLLVGPPGTAKSELARRIHTAFHAGHYFERLLTRFSVPEELFGPLSIKALEADRYERQTRGFLPDATIAFIDEVFKANSAILNALLTLLNEREFDNGAGRQACPLISVIGATNEVPEDEVGEAFFDRFLVRVPINAVSTAGFSALLETGKADAWTPPADALPFRTDELASLKQAAALVSLTPEVGQILAELRAQVAIDDISVSDRRWVKITGFLRIAAATEGRGSVALWDLLLLPWCMAPDAARQALINEWLQARLGVIVAFLPERLMRVVQAFELQLEAEQKANDLDYDESGRLRFSATDLAKDIGDAKQGAAALRMTHSRQRRYGARHIAARTGQLDATLQRIAGYLNELDGQQRNLAEFRQTSLWLPDTLLDRIADNLATTAAAIAGLQQRTQALRAGFAALPRLAEDNNLVPDPVAHEPMPAL
jgi:MoxR-like ATPase